MGESNITGLAERCLALLAQSGMSTKAVWTYKQYGIRAITCHFINREISDYSESEVDNFMTTVRAAYENGDIQEWKWQKIRKASAFLESVHKNDTLDLTHMLPWAVEKNPIHKKPALNQLEDKTDIFVLVYHVKCELQKLGLSQGTVKAYTYYGFDPILRYYTQHGLDKYSKSVLHQFSDEVKSKYANQEIRKGVCQISRKAALLLEEYYVLGSIQWRHQPRIGSRILSEYFSKTWGDFCAEHEGVLSELTIATIRSAAHRFMFALEDMGFQNFCEVTPFIVSNCISHMARLYSGGQNALLFSLRTFLRFLKKSGITDSDLSAAVPELAAPKRVIQRGFSDDEVNRVLNFPDRNTPIGKRDYAIMVLANQTGLRAIDIKNLKRQNIDWRKNEIQIVQHKTKRPLSLPLTSKSGNAIADYLLNGRPASDLQHIFLCDKKPLRPMSTYAVSQMVSECIDHSGIPHISRRGTHSFRRTFGKKLLEAEIPLDMLSELLGHTHMDSAKPYLPTNEMELKRCALSLASIMKAGEQS